MATESSKNQTPAIDYQKLFAALPDRYIAVLPDDPTFTIVAENKSHAAVAFVKTKDIIGLPLLEAFPDTSEKYARTGVSDLLESFRRVIRTGKPDTMSLLRYDLKNRDGTIVPRYWRVTHYPLFSGSGKDRRMEAVFQATHDITDSVIANQKLSTAQTQLDDVLSAGQIGTWVWDIPNDTVVGDKYMAKMFGVPPRDATQGLPLATFIGAIYTDDRRRVQKEITAALKSATTFESEYRTISHDGSISWVIARGRIERDNRGRPINFPGVLVDITERKQIENNLSYLAKASAVLSASLDYHTTLQSIAELLVPEFADWCTIDILTDQGELELVALAHKDPAKITWARQLREAQGPPDLSASTGVAKVINEGATEYYPLITEDMILATASSEEEIKLLRDLSLTSIIIVPIIVNNKPLGAITMISTELKRTYTPADVEMASELANRASLAISNARLYDEAQHELRERTRLEEELRLVNDELEHRVEVRTTELEQLNVSLQRSNQELQNFAYVASHDLQEPLRKIQAFGNLLETEYSPELGEGGQDYLRRMRGAAARMSALIEDILSFSRVTTKGREFTLVNLGKVAREVIDDLEVRIKETNATIKVGKLPAIHADPTQMRQLLQNLVANAIKFHRPDADPSIRITSKTEVQADNTKICRLAVADNGLGFEEKYLDRIFDVFQRLHNRDSYEGTGIGLAVCRKIVERHGGHITATSKPGKGSTFIVRLPMRHKKGENLL